MIYKVMKKFFQVIIFLLALLSVSSCSSQLSTIEEDVPVVDSSVEEQNISDSTLEKLFILTGSNNMMVSDIENYISENNLVFEKRTENGIDYMVAKSPEVAKFKHAMSGEKVEISFDENGDFKYATYEENNYSVLALNYNHGDWWDFSTQNKGNYSGYYTVDSGSADKGIEIEYQNGSKTETNYVKSESAEKALNIVKQKGKNKQ